LCENAEGAGENIGKWGAGVGETDIEDELFARNEVESSGDAKLSLTFE